MRLMPSIVAAFIQGQQDWLCTLRLHHTTPLTTITIHYSIVLLIKLLLASHLWAPTTTTIHLNNLHVTVALQFLAVSQSNHRVPVARLRPSLAVDPSPDLTILLVWIKNSNYGKLWSSLQFFLFSVAAEL